MINNSKLIKNLHFLSPKELRRFKEFVHSPFFNKHQPTTQLVYFLMENFQELATISKQDIFNHLFPKEDFEEFKVNILISYLMNLLDQFLTQIGFERRNEKWGYNLETVLDLNMEQLFKTNTKKAPTHSG